MLRRKRPIRRSSRTGCCACPTARSSEATPFFRRSTVMAVSRRGYRPAGRREAFSVVHDSRFYLCHGIADLKYYNDDGSWTPQGEEGVPMQCFDFTTGTWKGIKPTTQEPEESRLWHSLSALYAGVCCVVLNDCLYSFGGRRGGRERGCADVHELNLTSMVWRKLEPVNPEEGPMEKEKGGMVDYKGELLCVFGGYGMGTFPRQPGAAYHWDRAFDRFWNNELHLFDLEKRKWLSPQTTGIRPLPCAGFSFTKVDPQRAILFGGRQRQERVNEINILDMESWHWSGAYVPITPHVPWPKRRSVHAACAIVDPNLSTEDSCSPQPKLFVLGGAGNDGYTINDAWILDVNSVTWKQVPLPPQIDKARMCHSLGAYFPSACEAHVIGFGGLPGKIEKDAAFTSFTPLEETIVLQFGTPTLYQSCISYIHSHTDDYRVLLPFLPAHIQLDIITENEKETNLKEFIVARL